MGYTNYWAQNKKQDKFSDEFVEKAREICRLGFDRGIELASGDGETSFGVFELNEELLKTMLQMMAFGLMALATKAVRHSHLNHKQK